MSDETYRVVRGNPTPEELAAALAVVQARAAGAPGQRAGARRTDEWADEWAGRRRALLARRPPAPGPGAWRTTYWPT